ncbi:MAG: hypothetical protein ACP5N9_03280 [Candidatus Bilamarchaeum sp.]|jgi:hypothetical protein
MNHQRSIRESLAHADWDEIIKMMEKIEFDLEINGSKGKKLRAHVGLVKLIMCSKMGSFNGDNSIDMSFFVASHKAVKKLEDQFENNQIRNREFIAFLKLILHKMSKQKLKVKKQREIKDNFERMKGVVENGHSTL